MKQASSSPHRSRVDPGSHTRGANGLGRGSHVKEDASGGGGVGYSIHNPSIHYSNIYSNASSSGGGSDGLSAGGAATLFSSGGNDHTRQHSAVERKLEKLVRASRTRSLRGGGGATGIDLDANITFKALNTNATTSSGILPGTMSGYHNMGTSTILGNSFQCETSAYGALPTTGSLLSRPSAHSAMKQQGDGRQPAPHYSPSITGNTTIRRSSIPIRAAPQPRQNIVKQQATKSSAPPSRSQPSSIQQQQQQQHRQSQITPLHTEPIPARRQVFSSGEATLDPLAFSPHFAHQQQMQPSSHFLKPSPPPLSTPHYRGEAASAPQHDYTPISQRQLRQGAAEPYTEPQAKVKRDPLLESSMPPLSVLPAQSPYAGLINKNVTALMQSCVRSRHAATAGSDAGKPVQAQQQHLPMVFRRQASALGEPSAIVTGTAARGAFTNQPPGHSTSSSGDKHRSKAVSQGTSTDPEASTAAAAAAAPPRGRVSSVEYPQKRAALQQLQQQQQQQHKHSQRMLSFPAQPQRGALCTAAASASTSSSACEPSTNDQQQQQQRSPLRESRELFPPGYSNTTTTATTTTTDAASSRGGGGTPVLGVHDGGTAFASTVNALRHGNQPVSPGANARPAQHVVNERDQQEVHEGAVSDALATITRKKMKEKAAVAQQHQQRQQQQQHIGTPDVVPRREVTQVHAGNDDHMKRQSPPTDRATSITASTAVVTSAESSRETSTIKHKQQHPPLLKVRKGDKEGGSGEDDDQTSSLLKTTPQRPLLMPLAQHHKAEGDDTTTPMASVTSDDEEMRQARETAQRVETHQHVAIQEKTIGPKEELVNASRHQQHPPPPLLVSWPIVAASPIRVPILSAESTQEKSTGKRDKETEPGSGCDREEYEDERTALPSAEATAIANNQSCGPKTPLDTSATNTPWRRSIPGATTDARRFSNSRGDCSTATSTLAPEMMMMKSASTFDEARRSESDDEDRDGGGDHAQKNTAEADAPLHASHQIEEKQRSVAGEHLDKSPVQHETTRACEAVDRVMEPPFPEAPPLSGTVSASPWTMVATDALEQACLEARCQISTLEDQYVRLNEDTGEEIEDRMHYVEISGLDRLCLRDSFIEDDSCESGSDRWDVDTDTYNDVYHRVSGPPQYTRYYISKGCQSDVLPLLRYPLNAAPLPVLLLTRRQYVNLSAALWLSRFQSDHGVREMLKELNWYKEHHHDLSDSSDGDDDMHHVHQSNGKKEGTARGRREEIDSDSDGENQEGSRQLCASCTSLEDMPDFASAQWDGFLGKLDAFFTWGVRTWVEAQASRLLPQDCPEEDNKAEGEDMRVGSYAVDTAAMSPSSDGSRLAIVKVDATSGGTSTTAAASAGAAAAAVAAMESESTHNTARERGKPAAALSVASAAHARCFSSVCRSLVDRDNLDCLPQAVWKEGIPRSLLAHVAAFFTECTTSGLSVELLSMVSGSNTIAHNDYRYSDGAATTKGCGGELSCSDPLARKQAIQQWQRDVDDARPTWRLFLGAEAWGFDLSEGLNGGAASCPSRMTPGASRLAYGFMSRARVYNVSGGVSALFFSVITQQLPEAAFFDTMILIEKLKLSLVHCKGRSKSRSRGRGREQCRTQRATASGWLCSTTSGTDEVVELRDDRATPSPLSPRANLSGVLSSPPRLPPLPREHARSGQLTTCTSVVTEEDSGGAGGCGTHTEAAAAPSFLWSAVTNVAGPDLRAVASCVRRFFPLKSLQSLRVVYCALAKDLADLGLWRCFDSSSFVEGAAAAAVSLSNKANCSLMAAGKTEGRREVSNTSLWGAIETFLEADNKRKEAHDDGAREEVGEELATAVKKDSFCDEVHCSRLHHHHEVVAAAVDAMMLVAARCDARHEARRSRGYCNCKEGSERGERAVVDEEEACGVHDDGEISQQHPREWWYNDVSEEDDTEDDFFMDVAEVNDNGEGTGSGGNRAEENLNERETLMRDLLFTHVPVEQLFAYPEINDITTAADISPAFGNDADAEDASSTDGNIKEISDNTVDDPDGFASALIGTFHYGCKSNFVEVVRLQCLTESVRYALVMQEAILGATRLPEEPRHHLHPHPTHHHRDENDVRSQGGVEEEEDDTAVQDDLGSLATVASILEALCAVDPEKPRALAEEYTRHLLVLYYERHELDGLPLGSGTSPYEARSTAANVSLLNWFGHNNDSLNTNQPKATGSDSERQERDDEGEAAAPLCESVAVLVHDMAALCPRVHARQYGPLVLYSDGDDDL